MLSLCKNARENIKWHLFLHSRLTVFLIQTLLYACPVKLTLNISFTRCRVSPSSDVIRRRVYESSNHVVVVIGSRSHFAFASNCLAKSLISPLRWTEKRTKLCPSRPTFFHLAVKLMTTPGALRHEEGRPLCEGGDQSGRGMPSARKGKEKDESDRENGLASPRASPRAIGTPLMTPRIHLPTDGRWEKKGATTWMS